MDSGIHHTDDFVDWKWHVIFVAKWNGFLGLRRQMALVHWFAKTRRVASAPLAPKRDATLLSRKLETTEGASMRIFGQFKNPEPGARSGRDRLREHRHGPALARWYQPHLRTIPGLWSYKTEEERYKLAKNSFLRTKGKIAPKKGAGKKALKRMADAKKAAAKAAKGK